MRRCECPCGCRRTSSTKFCPSCHWDMIDAASGSFLASPGVKQHAAYVERVEQVGPMLVPVLKADSL